MSTVVGPLGRTGVRISQLDQLPWPEAVSAASELESIGYPALWVSEVFGRDPLVTSALLLSATHTTAVALGIANVYGRDAVAMTASHYTLSEAFPGRFVLGLGVGSPPVSRARGHPFDRPLQYLTGYLAAMDAARYAAVRPEAPPRRLLAALGPKMLDMAARHADGAHTILTTPRHTALARAILGPQVSLVVEQVVVLDEDLERATMTAWRGAVKYRLAAPSFRAHLCRLGFGEQDWADPSVPSMRVVDAVVACGNGEAIAERVAAHRAAGADHVVVQVLSSDGQVPLAQWRALAPFVL